MTILIQRAATPAEIAAELDESVSNVAYHIDILKRFGCIRLISVEPAAGGRVVEHLYKAADRVYLDADAWDQLGEKEKLKVVISLMRLVSEDVNSAMSKGTFFEPDDNHLSRSPMTVDMEGWQEVIKLLDGTVDGLFEIQGRIAARGADGDQETFPIKVEILQFRSPAKK